MIANILVVPSKILNDRSTIHFGSAVLMANSFVEAIGGVLSMIYNQCCPLLVTTVASMNPLTAQSIDLMSEDGIFMYGAVGEIIAGAIAWGTNFFALDDSPLILVLVSTNRYPSARFPVCYIQNMVYLINYIPTSVTYFSTKLSAEVTPHANNPANGRHNHFYIVNIRSFIHML
jgi:hypothetical protein